MNKKIKKIFFLSFGLTGLVAAATSALVSCGWSTPPIPVSKLSDIMKIVQKQVYDLGSKSDDGVPEISGNYGNFPSAPSRGKDNAETSKNANDWADNLVGGASNWYSSGPIGVALNNFIKGAKNIVSGSDAAGDFVDVKNYLPLFLQKYITITIADVGAIMSQDKVIWLSSMSDKSELRQVKSGRIDVPTISASNMPIKEKNTLDDDWSKLDQVLDKDNKPLYSYLNTDKLIDLSNEKFKEAIQHNIRMLVSFTPDKSFNVDPIEFYLDTILEK